MSVQTAKIESGCQNSIRHREEKIRGQSAASKPCFVLSSVEQSKVAPESLARVPAPRSRQINGISSRSRADFRFPIALETLDHEIRGAQPAKMFGTKWASMVVLAANFKMPFSSLG